MISVCYSLTQGGANSIVLYSGMKNVNGVAQRIRESGLFSTVIVTDYLDAEYHKYEKAYNKTFINRRKKKIQLIETEHDMAIFNENLPYVFNDSSVVGYYLNLKRIPYILLEDGLDHYAKNQVTEDYYKRNYECAFRYYVNSQIPSNGGAPFTREVWVNDADRVVVPYRAKYVSKPKKELLQALSIDDQHIICDIFDAEQTLSEIRKISEEKKTLFLTCPLAKDNVLNDENEQIKLISSIIDKYSDGLLIIKPHPRDTINYKDTFPNAYVVERNDIPVEVFDYSNLQFDKGITIGSTSLAGLMCVKDKIVISIEDCRKGIF